MRLDNIKLFLWDNLLIIKKSILYLLLLFVINTLLYKLMGYINFYNLLNFRHRGFIKKSVKYFSLENNNKLNPWFVTGFVDAEGCFNINITKSSSNLIGYQVQARFIIEVNIKDINILQKNTSFFWWYWFNYFY